MTPSISSLAALMIDWMMQASPTLVCGVGPGILAGAEEAAEVDGLLLGDASVADAARQRQPSEQCLHVVPPGSMWSAPSSLASADGHGLHHVPLEDQEQDHDRKRGDDARGHDAAQPFRLREVRLDGWQGPA